MDPGEAGRTMAARRDAVKPCRQIRSLALKNGGVLTIEIFGNFPAMCRQDRRLIEQILDAMEDREAVISGER